MRGVVAVALSSAAAGISARQLAPRPVEDWTARLERPDRVASLKIDYIISSLGLKPGVVVADIGAGPGVLTLPLAKAVAPAKVYAVEIEQGFLDRITEKARQAGTTNIVTVLGEFGDPKLPARDADVVLFHDVLHHVKDRAAYLRAAAAYVKPDGSRSSSSRPTAPTRTNRISSSRRSRSSGGWRMRGSRRFRNSTVCRASGSWSTAAPSPLVANHGPVRG